MNDDGKVTARVVENLLGSPAYIEVFSDDWMLGVWRSGYHDVWAFSLADKDTVRRAVRDELESRGRSL